ncbi:hypothetical protein [Mycobacterium sp. E3298]|uniref:hypothetical protein n=1 Tax=Mycobacterium sp. E3298 TaxID=1856865 RepID=UPI0012EAAA1D|nr:hypothetical protein [Mycobacterium sp. E3298]
MPISVVVADAAWMPLAKTSPTRGAAMTSPERPDLRRRIRWACRLVKAAYDGTPPN